MTDFDLVTAQALRRLVDQYAIEADQHDGAALAALFVEEGRLLIFSDGDASGEPVRLRVGRTEIATAIETLARYRRTFHLVGQHIAERVDDDHATSITYCQAHHVSDSADDTSTDRILFIRYLDDFVRDVGEWRFATRRLLLDFTETHPVD